MFFWSKGTPITRAAISRPVSARISRSFRRLRFSWDTEAAFPFIWDEKEFFVYPTLPNYQNGFAVAEANAEAPIAEIESTVTANANAFTSNWLNAEVDEAGVLIYQYYPGGNIAVYRLTKVGGGVEELINDSEKVVAGVRYYNIMGQEMNEANGITIVVTTYTDGSHSAVKVIK